LFKENELQNLIFLLYQQFVKRYFISIFILLISLDKCFPQLLPLKVYTTEDNLPNSSITTISQDASGHLWIGTLDGVSKFDGIEFRNFSLKEGLIDRVILSIYANEDGTVWIGTYAGLSKYENEKIKNFTTENGLIENEIWCIAKGVNNEIWFGTLSKGISIYSKNKFKTLTTKDGLISDSVLTIYNDNKGKIYIGTNNGLSIYDGNRFYNYTTKNGLPNNRIKVITKINNDLWLGTPKGLSRFDGKIFYNYFISDGMLDDNIMALTSDKENNLWIGTLKGLIKFSNRKFINYTKRNGLPTDIILSLYNDNENNIWIGTYESGIVQLKGEDILYFNSSNGLISNTVKSITKDKNNNYWFGTLNGLTKYDGNKFNNFSKSNGLPDDFIMSLDIDNNNNLWIGTKTGLIKYSNETSRWNIPIKSGFIDDGKFQTIRELKNKFISSIKCDSKNNIWIGTIENGLYKISKNKIIKFDSNDGLIDSSIYCIYEDKKNNIWFGLSNGILVKYTQNKFISYIDSQGIKSHPIYSITEDNKGNIWIGSHGGGISKLENNSFKNFNEKDGLSSDVCNLILFNDLDTSIWIGTNKGLHILSLPFDKQNTFKIITTKDGLISNEFEFNSYFQDENNFVWLGTIKGIMKLNKKFGKHKKPSHPIIIKSIKVLDRNIDQITNTNFDYDQNQITIEFRGICFSSQDKVKYKYKLEPIEKKWNITKNNSLKYNTLSPGKYNFIVYAINQDGIESLKPATFSFIIKTPFWDTIWFKFFIIIFLVGSTYSIYKRRLVLINRRNIYLENLVQERTTEVAIEKQNYEDLLKNILPSEAVIELHHKGFVEPKEFNSATILFTDFQGFTETTINLSPNELVKELHQIFSGFDDIISKYNLEKLKTIGDSYMAVGGILTPNFNHAEQTILAAFDMQNFIQERNHNSNVQWMMRIGINTGRVIAGIVGTKKFTFDIWGNAVNIANILERNCDVGKINISETTYELVKDKFNCEFRGTFDTKWINQLKMYYVSKFD